MLLAWNEGAEEAGSLHLVNIFLLVVASMELILVKVEVGYGLLMLMGLSVGWVEGLQSS